jgi:malto-oligosyltrehalose trehalohydrolase
MNALTIPSLPGTRPIQRIQRMKFGTELTQTGVRFRLWAPACGTVHLRIAGEPDVAMTSLPRGWFELEIEGAGPGTHYSFGLPDGLTVPDPASRYQPEDVHGPSEVIDPRAYPWRDAGWRGRPWEEAVIYELHVGAFTPEGTFAAVRDRIDDLVALGVTAIQLMPVADFEGRWNWGYDGVLHFAPDSTYGRPEDLKALVDAAHARGVMVFLDVVYNHFGPSGNYMSLYTPLTTEKHETPWGAAVNYDDEGSHMIRDFVFANARYWVNEFHVDGLRFDAVHEIQDSGPRHLLLELAEHLRGSTDGRHLHLIAENAANQAGWLKRFHDLRPWLYTAQWSDDIHHGLHSAVTGEDFAYYGDFAGRLDLLGRALAEGLAYQGEPTLTTGEEKGEPSADLPVTAFVAYIQNHDQTGNRPFGKRLHHVAPAAAVRAVAAIYLLAPEIPMLFMGEEWAADQPFSYFSDLTELADVIREARKREFAEAYAEGEESSPDPMVAETFASVKLDWDARERNEHARWLRLYRDLLSARHREIVPRLEGMGGHAGTYKMLGGRGLRVDWALGEGSTLTVIANLSVEPLAGIDVPAGNRIWLEGSMDDRRLGAWSVLWTLDGQPGSST